MKHTKPTEQKEPWSMKWHCPYCGRVEAVSARDFLLIFGHEWKYKEVYCEHCKQIYYLDD